MEASFDDTVIADFLRRSYFAVDGLWFVQTEQEHSYEEALRLDEQVWRIMPKIQARKARQLLGVDGGGLADLVSCFSLKLAAEGYDFETTRPSENEARIRVLHCPWYSILQHAGRESIAEDIADRICLREFAGWASEFSDSITVAVQERLCSGANKCDITFRR
jgi:hypothetical protein